MATSGVTSFNPTRDTVVYGALRLVGAYSIHTAPNTIQVTTALEALNMMLKSWQTEGHLWLRQWVTLFTVADQYKYLLPGARVAAQVIDTTLGAAEAALQTVLTVTDSTGMTAGDQVGVMLDDKTLHWTTIVSVDSTTQITITTGLTGAAASGNAVYTYTTAFGRPTRLFDQQRRDTNDYEAPLNLTARNDYFSKSYKSSRGTPVEVYYDPQLVNGALYVWPTPQDSSYRLMLHVDRIIEDMISDTNTFDVPQWWVEAVKYGLAVRLAPEYGITLGERQALNVEYTALKDNAMNYDRDPASVCFQPGE